MKNSRLRPARLALRTLTVAALATTTLTAGSLSASAHSEHGRPQISDPIVDGLAGPLQIDVSKRGVLIGQSFSGNLSQVNWGGLHDLANLPGIDGVAWARNDSVVYTHTDFEMADANGVAQAELRMFDRRGRISTLADLREHEVTQNPDGSQSYGFQGLSADCQAQLPPDEPLGPYTGLLDSHPYAIEWVGFGTVVADAGGNDILFVDGRGRVSTIAVLPPQGTTVTAEQAAAQGLPDCVAGATFNFEAVPTDVELGHDGSLYVSTLPGGPEDASLGARGSVYRVNAWSGRVKRVATGFLGATNLAVAPNGTIYVAELFGNKISKVSRRGVSTVVEVPNPAGLEWHRGRLFATTDVFGSGKLVTVRP